MAQTLGLRFSRKLRVMQLMLALSVFQTVATPHLLRLADECDTMDLPAGGEIHTDKETTHIFLIKRVRTCGRRRGEGKAGAAPGAPAHNHPLTTTR